MDRQRASLCRRAVPALLPANTQIKLLRVGGGSASDTVRVDFMTGNRVHQTLCQFNTGAELLAVTTDSKRLNGADLYLLKRYYLYTQESEGDDPIRPEGGG